jgi:hypothetical protein
VIQPHKPDLQDIILSHKKPPQKVSYFFIIQTYKPDLQDAVVTLQKAAAKSFILFCHTDV